MKAWIIQIASSNIMYILDIIIIVKNVFIFSVLEKDEIRIKITWPAVMFAVNRSLNVIGRTRTLIDSIKIKNGLSHRGALFGRKWAIVFFVDNWVLLVIEILHSGNPMDRVTIIWLVILNRYGYIPITFM